MKRLFLFLITICIGQIACHAYNGTINVRVGDTFNVDAGAYRYIQAVLWDFDPDIFETVSVSGYSTKGTFKARSSSPTAGSIIQATIYYYKDGVPNSGVVKDVASWKVYVKDDNSSETFTVSLPATMNIVMNGTKTITATPSSSNYPGSFYWKSDDSNIVEIVSSNSSSATLRANSVGSTYVYVTLDNGNYDRVYVTVKDNLEYYILSSTERTAGVRANPEGCSGAIIIPSTVKIGGDTYTVTAIPYDAFRNNTVITSVTIPPTITSIGSNAFRDCTGLISVKIGNQVSFIADDAFYGCEGLTKAEFASIESLCSIKFVDLKSNPLYYAHNLYIDGKKITNLEIPQTVNEIKRYSFARCTSITSVSISSSSIGLRAFENCTALTEVTIGESVTSIKGNAFYGCTELTEITIPSSVTEISSNPFISCSRLKEIKVDSNNNYFTAKDGVLYSKDLTTLKAFPGGKSSVEIPNTVETIGSYAFYNCSNLTSVSIPNSVTSIGSDAFCHCSGLTSVSIPNSVTSIGSSAFCDCKGISRITIPYSVKTIESSAFAMGDEVKEIYYYAKNPIEFQSDIFYLQLIGEVMYDTYKSATLYVHEEALDKCRNIEPWKNFNNIQAYEFSGIEEIKVKLDADTSYDIYNLNGVNVGDSIDTLTPGIYIVRHGTAAKKILVK